MEHGKVSHTLLVKLKAAYSGLKELRLIGLIIGKIQQKKVLIMKSLLKGQEHIATDKTLLPLERLEALTQTNSGLSHKTLSKG